MGQQQLLLLVLSALIVGAGVVVGINMFGENAAQANQDAVTQDCLMLATRASAYYRRPAAMGGGGRSFSGIALADLNYESPNQNGSYTISGSSGTCTVTGTGTEDPDGDGGFLAVTVAIDSVGAVTTSVNP